MDETNTENYNNSLGGIIMFISDDIKYIGVNDHEIDLFEGQYKVPNGMAYNSYVIMDDKIAIMDTVDIHFTKQWFMNVKEVLMGRFPDYLIIHHMEPDHSASIKIFMDTYPECKIVASALGFVMLNNYFGTDYADRKVIVKENDTLSLGKHTLTFISAPLVHWPEVIMSYDSYDKVLFSADAFGKFGALDVEEEWINEARRYYIGIVGKFGSQVQAVLKKLKNFDIQIICSLHGPVLQDHIVNYIDLYNLWSSYGVEKDGVVISYSSVYGNTQKAVELLKQQLEDKGRKVIMHDLSRCDMFKAVEDAFTYSHLILATTTYMGDIFPCMREYIHHLVERNYCNRTVSFIENGTWAPNANKVMKKMLETSKNLTYTQTDVTILGSLNEKSLLQLHTLVDEL